MATIERKPLPPPNSNSPVTTITEADRAEIIAHANDVIDYYLNGPGSYFDSGTRKPLANELGNDTINDLERFRDYVATSMQFADDPNSILQSIKQLIEKTITGVKETVQYDEGRQGILLPLPETNDPIDAPRAVNPRALANEALRISLPMEAQRPAPAAPLQAGLMPGIFNGESARILSRRIADQPLIFPLDMVAPVASDRPKLFDDRSRSGPSSTSVSAPRGPYQPGSSPASEPLGIVSGKPMPDWPFPPPIWDFPSKPAMLSEDKEDWFARLLRTPGAY